VWVAAALVVSVINVILVRFGASSPTLLASVQAASRARTDFTRCRISYQLSNCTHPFYFFRLS